MSFKDTLMSINYNGYNPNHKSFWNNLDDMDLKELADKIIKLTESLKSDIQNKINLRQRFEFTIVHKDNFSIWRNEEALERAIVAKNKEIYFNQINLKKGSKENIDLIKIDDKELTIYELKAENGKDTPLFALIELLKNYYLFKNSQIDDERVINKTIKLSILAPKEYYDNFSKNKLLVKFIELCTIIQNELGIDILIQEVAINSNDIKNKIDSNYTNDWNEDKRKIKENELKDIIKKLHIEILDIKCESEDI